ncbi:MAG: hypothetical protein JAY60_19575 [Candidatus Thiodiazotropha weberae]|nr:hypothetical protein [Candidatus Thiodiazotropha weberae]
MDFDFMKGGCPACKDETLKLYRLVSEMPLIPQDREGIEAWAKKLADDIALAVD